MTKTLHILTTSNKTTSFIVDEPAIQPVVNYFKRAHKEPIEALFIQTKGIAGMVDVTEKYDIRLR
jgi:hypothetical protein